MKVELAKSSNSEIKDKSQNFELIKIFFLKKMSENFGKKNSF